MDDEYVSYSNALQITGLSSLKERRAVLSLNFAKKCTEKQETKSMFPLNSSSKETRKKEKYRVTPARTSRLAKSAIPLMQRQLNSC